MGQRIAPGDRLPFFEYDTPYSAQNSFRALLEVNAPLVVVFMSNFGHPVTRTFVQRYAETRADFPAGGLALVVRSRPEKLNGSVHEDTLPYELLCDAEGVLYDYLDIPQLTGVLRTCSLEAWKILRDAKKQGYDPGKNTPQQMPLTLVLDADGTVLFAHYGSSLTDVPADCAAMQNLLEGLLAQEDSAAVPQQGDEQGTDDMGDLYPVGAAVNPAQRQPEQEQNDWYGSDATSEFAPSGATASDTADSLPAGAPHSGFTQMLDVAPQPAPTGPHSGFTSVLEPANPAGAPPASEETMAFVADPEIAALLHETPEETARRYSAAAPTRPNATRRAPARRASDATVPLEKTRPLGYFNEPYGEE